MVSVGVSSLGWTELIFIDPGVKIMVHTIVTFYSVSTYCLLLKNCRAVNFSYSSRTVLQLTEPEKLWICFQEKLQILFHPLFGPPIALISIRSTTRYGASFKNMFIKPAYATMTLSNNDLWRNGIVLIKELLIVQSMNGEIALEHVFELMAGILNISFEEQHLTQINFSCFCRIVKFNKK